MKNTNNLLGHFGFRLVVKLVAGNIVPYAAEFSTDTHAAVAESLAKRSSADCSTVHNRSRSHVHTSP